MLLPQSACCDKWSMDHSRCFLLPTLPQVSPPHLSCHVTKHLFDTLSLIECCTTTDWLAGWRSFIYRSNLMRTDRVIIMCSVPSTNRCNVWFPSGEEVWIVVDVWRKVFIHDVHAGNVWCSKRGDITFTLHISHEKVEEMMVDWLRFNINKITVL